VTGSYPDFYPNVPGSVFELRDNTRNQHSRTLRGKKIVLIGTANDGPVLNPVTVTSFDEGKNIFGIYWKENGQPNGTTLVKGLKRVLDAGADNVALVRVSGDTAHTKLPLYKTEKNIERHTREYIDQMIGNRETTFDLEIPAGTYIENVTLTANGFKVEEDLYRIDESNGIIILKEDAVDQEANVVISYNLVKVTIVSIDEEEVVCTSPLSGREFQLKNPLVERDSESVYHVKEDGTVLPLEKGASAQGYTIDYTTGLISTTDEVVLTKGELLVATYDYRKLEKEAKTSHQVARGGISYIQIRYQPDPTKEFVVLADGKPVDKAAYDVNYTYGYVNLKPGYIGKGQKVEIVYYWNDREVIEPAILFEGFYPGSVYNKVKIVTEDVLQAVPNLRYFQFNNPNGTTLVPGGNVENNHTFFFPEDRRNLIQNAGVELSIFDDSGNKVSDLNEEDFTVDYNTGSVVLSTSAYEFFSSILDGQIRATKYAYSIQEYTPMPTVYNEYLQIVDPNTARFHNDYIVPTAIEFMIEDRNGNLSPYNGTVEIDYATGLVKLNNALAFGERLLAREYSYYNVVGKKVAIKKPREKLLSRTDGDMEFEIGANIQTVGELVDAINNHPRNNVVRASIDPKHAHLSAMDIMTEVYKVNPDGSINAKEVALEFGDDGVNLTKEEMYDKLGGVTDKDGNKVVFGAYDILMDYEDADIIVPLGVYIDDELTSNYKNFATQLANFCAKCFYRSNEIIGVMGFNPLHNPSRINIINRVKKLQDVNLNFFLQDENYNEILDNNGHPVDIGRYMRAVGHDLIYNDPYLSAPTIENGALAFAAVKSMLAEDNAPTNEVIPGAMLAYTYSAAQTNSLSGARIITFRSKNGEARIADGITCALPGSGWTRDLTVTIVFDIIEEIRRIYDRYIGKGNTMARQNALDSDIRDALNKKHTLEDFDYKLIMSPTDKLIGRMIVDLELVPIGELQRIKTVVSINSQLQ